MDDTDSEKLPYAGLMRRAAAIILDTFLMCVVFVLMQGVQSSIQLQDTLYPLVIAVYFLGFEGGKWRATLGKRLLKIQIGGLDGEKADPVKILVRYVAYIVPAMPFIWISMTADFAGFMQTVLHIDDMLGPGSHKLFLQTPESHSLLFKLAHTVIFYFAARFIFYILPITLSDEKAGLHDWVSKTRVYKKPVAETVEGTAAPATE